MRKGLALLLLPALFILTSLIAGCGGSSTTSSATAPTGSAANPGAANPGGSQNTPTPGSGSGSGSGSSGSGSSGSGSGSPASPAPGNGNPVAPTTSFVATLVGSDGSTHGQIAVNTTEENGQVTLQLKNATPNTKIDVIFCPNPTNSGPRGNDACLFISGQQYSTDSSGNGAATFSFGKSGTWSGIFEVNTQMMEQSGFQMPADGTQFQAALKLCGKISSIFEPGYLCGTDQLSSGYVTVNGTTVHVNLRGAKSLTTYTLSRCDNRSSAPCSAIGTFSTDGTGDSDFDLNYETALGTSVIPSTFAVERDEGNGSRTEFASAFTVP